MSFIELLKTNIKMLYRDKTALFWNIMIPVLIYSALATIPTAKFTGNLVYKNFLLPGIIAYIIMQGGVYSLAYWMVELRSRGVIKRFMVTPIRMSELVISLICSRLLLIAIQTIMLSLIGILIFDTPFAYNIISIAVLVTLGGGIFLLLGLLISNFAGSYQSASPITAAIGLPLTFLGNIFIPLELLPKSLQVVGSLLPVTHLANGLRNAYLEPFSLNLVGKDILILCGWLIAMLLLTISVFRLKE